MNRFLQPESPRPMVATVARPTLLWLVSTLAFGAALLAGAGFWTLHGARLAAPVTLVTETDRLADALAKSPWTASPENGPIVWAITPPNCRDCGHFAPASVIALSDEEMEIRMIVVAARGEAAPSVAALAERRDWEALRAWTRGEAMTLQQPDPAAEEGYLEWGRASWDRVAAVLRENGVEPRLPLLIWRRGPEWRVLIGGGAASLDAVRRDMAVES